MPPLQRTSHPPGPSGLWTPSSMPWRWDKDAMTLVRSVASFTSGVAFCHVKEVLRSPVDRVSGLRDSTLSVSIPGVQLRHL